MKYFLEYTLPFIGVCIGLVLFIWLIRLLNSIRKSANGSAAAAISCFRELSKINKKREEQ